MRKLKCRQLPNSFQPARMRSQGNLCNAGVRKAELRFGLDRCFYCSSKVKKKWNVYIELNSPTTYHLC